MKGISPIWLTIVATVVAIDQAIGGGTISLDHVFPETWAPWIKGWAGFLGGILGFVVAALTTIVSSEPGVLIKPQASSAAKLAVLAIGVSLLFAFGTGTASAAVLAKPTIAKVDPLQKLMDDISSKSAEVISGVVSALQEADDDAATLTNPSDPTSFRDPIAHACYPAQIKFLQSLPQFKAVKAPAPENVIVYFQLKRDFVAQIKAGVPSYLKVGCSALLQDETQIVIQTLGLIGVTVGAGALTGAFPAAAPITLPALGL